MLLFLQLPNDIYLSVYWTVSCTFLSYAHDLVVRTAMLRCNPRRSSIHTFDSGPFEGGQDLQCLNLINYFYRITDRHPSGGIHLQFHTSVPWFLRFSTAWRSDGLNFMPESISESFCTPTSKRFQNPLARHTVDSGVQKYWPTRKCWNYAIFWKWARVSASCKRFMALNIHSSLNNHLERSPILSWRNVKDGRIGPSIIQRKLLLCENSLMEMKKVRRIPNQIKDSRRNAPSWKNTWFTYWKRLVLISKCEKC